MSERIKIIIVDYGMGNLYSVKKKLEHTGVTPIVSSDPEEILKADKLILPGVGHFGKAMENLRANGLIDALNQAVLEEKVPILGICLGMQLMAQKSEEGNTEGLGWFNAEIVRFAVNDSLKFKVPHTGWNQVKCTKKSVLFNAIDADAEFYFVHSYHIRVAETDSILNTTNYESEFTSAIEKENIYGVQYHPEKSHDSGIQLLKNFISI